jgi:hypothetical protein
LSQLRSVSGVTPRSFAASFIVTNGSDIVVMFIKVYLFCFWCDKSACVDFFIEIVMVYLELL